MQIWMTGDWIQVGWPSCALEIQSNTKYAFFFLNFQGTWGNIFSQSFMDAVYLSGHSEDFWHRWTRDTALDIG